MKILGITGAALHDNSAALLVDGKLVAAAEEERFIRIKHAKRKQPINAIKYCLDYAGVSPSEIDIVAYPYVKVSLAHKARWYYAKRHWYEPRRVLRAIFDGNRHVRRTSTAVLRLLDELGIGSKRVRFVPVEHHLAHASSAYHLSGFTEKTAIVSIDGKGEYATTFFGYGENGRIHKIKEFYDPDSLGWLYGAITEYLGFQIQDGEYKVMGMAPYGEPNKYDLSPLIRYSRENFKVNTRLVNVIGRRCYRYNGKSYFFTPEFVKWLGPVRNGDDIDDPYVHYAAATQKLLENAALTLVDYYIGDIIRETGRLCFAGGVALNVKLNQRLLEWPHLKELFVQPAAGDAGTSLGAASYVAMSLGENVRKMQHAYLGPDFTTDECIAACQAHQGRPKWSVLDDASATGAQIIADGHPLAWFQGRMEFGPRALGNRSILGDPSQPGMADRINAQIKYRERWRPFCPSILDDVAADIIQSHHPAPYMTITFDVSEPWKARIPEVIHKDGTARVQVVDKSTNPRFYHLIKELEERTGNAVVLNTSLNRRGEPMVCTPADALNMFYGSDLQYLIMEDILITKD
ncbi:MAG: carbamoyltransferase [Acidiferrobacterales bacterium]